MTNLKCKKCGNTKFNLLGYYNITEKDVLCTEMFKCTECGEENSKETIRKE